VFDWRSVGGIIMSYIETPKEEYKKVYDLQIQALKDKKEDDDIFDCRVCPFLLKPVGLNEEEIDQVVEILLEKLGCDGLYPQYKEWLKDCDARDVVKVFDWMQRYKLWNLCDDPLMLRFKLQCDYIKAMMMIHWDDEGDDPEWVVEVERLQEIEYRVISSFNKIVYQEMWNDGTLSDDSEEAYYAYEEYYYNTVTVLEDPCAMIRPEESEEECEDEYDY